MSRVQFRRYLEKYLPERICWTSVGRIYNQTNERDTHRYYWSSKMAKDFIMLTHKLEFTFNEIESYFQEKVILNYLNEMRLEAFTTFEWMLMNKAG